MLNEGTRTDSGSPRRNPSIGDLLRAHLSLAPREAAAIVLELCRSTPVQQGSRTGPPLDDIALGPRGTVMHVSTAPRTDEERLREAALALRAMLPDPGDEDDDPIADTLRALARAALKPAPGLVFPSCTHFCMALSAFVDAEPSETARRVWQRWTHAADGAEADDLPEAGPVASTTATASPLPRIIELDLDDTPWNLPAADDAGTGAVLRRHA